MLNRATFLRLCFAALVAVIACCVPPCIDAEDNAGPRLTIDQVRSLVESGLSEREIVDQLSLRGFDALASDAQAIDALKTSGASQNLLLELNLRVGETLFDDRDFGKALAWYERIAKKFSRSPYPLIGAARALLATGRYAEGLESLNSASELGGFLPEICELRCQANLWQRDYQLAMDDATRLIEQQPPQPKGFLYLAMLHAASPLDEMRDGKAAQTFAQKGMELLIENDQEDEKWEMMQALAASHAEQNDFQSAIRVQRECLQVAPQSAHAEITSWLRRYERGIKRRFSTEQGDRESEQDAELPARNAGDSHSDAHRDEIAQSTDIIKMLKDRMIEVSGGEFEMGSQRSGAEDETPVHKRQVATFLLGRYEVTKREYAIVMWGGASSVTEPDHPAEGLSWSDCHAFITRLNDLAGSKVFRLPTEAEWEYAARAGSQSDYFFNGDESGLGEFAWYEKNSGSSSHPVGELQPNPWGFFDIYGNIGEWCEDQYQDYVSSSNKAAGSAETLSPLRVFRGGGWANSSNYCRSAARGVGLPNDRRMGLGFRLAMDAKATSAPPSPSDAPPSEPPTAEKPAASKSSYDDDITALVAGLKREPDNPQIAVQLSRLYFQRGEERYEEKQYQAAVDDLRRSINAVPPQAPGGGFPQPYLLLSWILATCPDDGIRSGKQAVEFGEHACSLTRWEDWKALHSFAAAFAEQGKFDRAIRRQRDAIEKAPPDDREVCEKRMKQYESLMPVRTSSRW